MKVLADLHHHDLYYSLQILFTKRLGWDLYRPIGMEWYHEGFWNVYPHINTAKQYLSDEFSIPLDIHGNPIDKDHSLSGWMNRYPDQVEDGIFEVRDFSHPEPIHHKAITLPRFKDEKFDIIISSMPNHIACFDRLIKEYQPQAKHIFQAGNNWRPPKTVKNYLNSTTMPPPPGANHVRYHQEFNLNVFRPDVTPNPRSIMNLQHIMDPQAKPIFKQLRSHLTDWDVKAYGAFNPDGALDRMKLPETLRQCGFLYHVKFSDEGYGYNLHNAAACGTPLVVSIPNQANFTAGALYIDGKTCIDVSCRSPQDVAIMLNEAADNYEEWSENIYNHFKQVVDFDKEFEEIKKFLERLQ